MIRFRLIIASLVLSAPSLAVATPLSDPHQPILPSGYLADGLISRYATLRTQKLLRNARYISAYQLQLGTDYLSGTDEIPKNVIAAYLWLRSSAMLDPEFAGGEARHQLGELYSGKSGFKKDYAEALKWYRLAAEDSGNVESQNALGLLYVKGQEGIEKDYSLAFRWFLVAANQNHATAQYNLGQMYFKGLGVEKDDREAVHWFRKAAAQQDLDAQFKLASIYATGEQVQQDYVKAYMWYHLVDTADDTDTSAKGPLEGLSLKLRPEQVTEAVAMANTCKESDFKNCD